MSSNDRPATSPGAQPQPRQHRQDRQIPAADHASTGRTTPAARRPDRAPAAWATPTAATPRPTAPRRPANAQARPPDARTEAAPATPRPSAARRGAPAADTPRRRTRAPQRRPRATAQVRPGRQSAPRTGAPCPHSHGRPRAPGHARAPDTAETSQAAPRPDPPAPGLLAGGATPSARRYPSSGSSALTVARSVCPAARRAAQKRSATSDDKPDTATPSAASQPLNAATSPSCLPTGCGLYPCRDNSAANPATNGPSGPGTPTPDTSAISTISSPAINTSETISAKPLRLCTPHPGPMTLSAGTS